jgi:hypothetical protein
MEKEPIRKQDTKGNNQSTPSIQSLHSIKSRDKTAETHTSFDMSRKSKSKDQTKVLFTLTQGDLVQEALAVTFAKDQTQALNIPVKVPLGGGRYAELTEWNGSKRVDLRFWETDKIPTKNGASLSLSQWKVLCSATQVVDDLISRAKDGEPVDWRYHLGEDVYVIIKAPQLTIHIRKHFVPNGEWTLHPTKIGVTLSFYEWKELKKTIPLFEDREPELRTMDNKVNGED